MASRLILHIGAMKSGTSFIQNVCSQHKQELADLGFLFPGKVWRRQVSAVHDLIERGDEGQEPMAPDGPWRTMAAEINAWPGTAIFSMEFLAPRTRPKQQQIKDSFPGTDIQVVHTVRDLARTLPAMWQESVQNEWPYTWPDFLDAVKKADMTVRNPGRWFWRHQRPAEIGRRWMETFGRDHYTLVTVPPKGAPPRLLWDRFAEVAGIPGDFDISVRSNPSLGLASAMVVRDVSERIQGEQPISRNDYLRHVKKILAKEGLATRTGEPSLGVDQKWVLKAGQEQVDNLRVLDPRVVGDLEELVPAKVDGVHSKKVSLEERYDALLDGTAHLVRDRIAFEEQTQRQLRRLRAQLRQARADAGSEEPDEPEESEDSEDDTAVGDA